MSALIESQLVTMLVMGCGGMAAGLIHQVFGQFMQVRKVSTAGRCVLVPVCYLCIGLLFGEFLFYCENGKVSFLPVVSFLAGMWAWRKIRKVL